MKLILATIVVAFVVGLAAGGSLARFPAIPVRRGWLAVAGIALQLMPLSGDAAFAALIGSFVLLLAFGALNLRAPGFLLIVAGLSLNLFVIALNHGMPVTAQALRESGQYSSLGELTAHGGAKHHLADPSTSFALLADVIAIPEPIGQAISLGDICVHLGVAWFIVAGMQPGRERRLGGWVSSGG